MSIARPRRRSTIYLQTLRRISERNRTGGAKRVLFQNIADRLTIAQHKSTLKISSLETECVMIAKYDIFKLRSDGSFVRVEAVEDILAAKQRLDILSVKEPGDYHLWDSSSHKFVNPFAKSASS